MVNSRKLKALLVENSYTQSEVAKLLGISTNAFSRKLNNKSQFTLNEAYLLKNILNVVEFERIFFENLIPNTQQKEVYKK